MGLKNYIWGDSKSSSDFTTINCREMDLDDALSSRDHIKAKLKAAI